MSDEVTRVSRPDNILVPSQNKMGWKYINKDKYFKFKQNKSDKDPTASLNVGKIPTLSINKHVSFDQSKIENLTEDIKKNNVNRDQIIEQEKDIKNNRYLALTQNRDDDSNQA